MPVLSLLSLISASSPKQLGMVSPELLSPELPRRYKGCAHLGVGLQGRARGHRLCRRRIVGHDEARSRIDERRRRILIDIGTPLCCVTYVQWLRLPIGVV